RHRPEVERLGVGGTERGQRVAERRGVQPAPRPLTVVPWKQLLELADGSAEGGAQQPVAPLLRAISKRCRVGVLQRCQHYRNAAARGGEIEQAGRNMRPIETIEQLLEPDAVERPGARISGEHTVPGAQQFDVGLKCRVLYVDTLDQT